MPFYILHQNVLFLGFFIIHLAIFDPVKYLIIVVGTLVVFMSMYEYLVRRYNAIRIPFGMKLIIISDPDGFRRAHETKGAERMLK